MHDSSSCPPEYAVRPKGAGSAARLIIGSVIFGLLGISAVLTGQDVAIKLMGAVGVVFFGGGLLLILVNRSRGAITLVLSPQGIEQRSSAGVACIPWQDIEDIGVPSQPGEGTSAGVRLRTYDNYLAMSPELAKTLAQWVPFVNGPTGAARDRSEEDARALWTRRNQREEWANPQGSDDAVADLAGLLVWSRKTYGYDVMIAASDLDQSPEDFAKLLERYQEAYGK